jgi:hypothetical protein
MLILITCYINKNFDFTQNKKPTAVLWAKNIRRTHDDAAG